MKFVLKSQVFPAGTTVKAYLTSNWSQADLPRGTKSPPGAVTAEAVVTSDGTLTFEGLVQKKYVAAAQVGGTWRYVEFFVTPLADELPPEIGSSSQEIVVRSDGTVGWVDPLEVNLRGWGVTGVGTAGDAKKIQEAVESLAKVAAESPNESGAGGVIRSPQGTINIDSTIKLVGGQERITIKGAGKGSTVFLRSANIPIFVIEGEGDSNAQLYENCTLEGMTLDSATRNVGTWTEPFIRTRYVQFFHMRNVNFRRAGGSAIKAVRTSDCEWQNVRWDYCGAAGFPTVHLMCSEQGRVEGEAGFSTDSCNNISFLDCWWEQNVGMDLHLDGRQSDGTYNASRRINGINFSGNCKMENHENTERSSEPRMKWENCSHITAQRLLLSTAGESASGTTDMFVMKKCFDTKINHLEFVGTEHGVNGIKAGLRLEETVGTKIDLISGNFQANSRPSEALIVFSGENTEVGWPMQAYYDNNPGGSALWKGNATSWVNDPYGGKAVVPPDAAEALFLTAALKSKTTYYVRRVAKRPMRIKTMKFVVTVAATTDQPVQVGICKSDSKFTPIAKSAETTGKLNGTGIKEVELSEVVQLDPGTVYYEAYSFGEPPAAGVVATLYALGNAGSNQAAQSMSGATPPNVGFMRGPEGTSFPIPAEAKELSSGIAAAPAGYLLPG